MQERSYMTRVAAAPPPGDPRIREPLPRLGSPRPTPLDQIPLRTEGICAPQLVEAGKHLDRTGRSPRSRSWPTRGVENVNAAIERVRTLVAFFVAEHNTKMPPAAFRGQTPDEVFFGTAPNLSAELDAARAQARELRLAANRS